MTTKLSGQLQLFVATEGSAIPNTTEVATFSDSNLSDTANEFSATIVWGDGNTSPGTVSGSNGSFTVDGGNTYASEGFFNATVTITGPGNSQLGLPGTITVTGDDNLTGSSNLVITAAPNQPLNNVVVATFSDSDNLTPANDFTTAIDWGDGTPTTAGTLSGSNGSFTVVGSHTYAVAGDYTVTTFMDDIVPDTANGAATTQADIGFGGNETLNAATADVAIPSGTQVANFVDNAGDPSTDYTATIDWGDGNTQPGAVSGSNGQFTVAATSPETYADFGDFTLTVTVENTANTTTATMSGTVAVADDDSFGATGTTLRGSPNQPLSNVTVATFNDADTLTTASELVATIVWGDGTSSVGTVSGGSGSFAVDGSHTYTQAGKDIVTVEIADAPADGQGLASTETASSAIIGLIPGAASSFSAPEGTPIAGGTIATFIDGNLSDTAVVVQFELRRYLSRRTARLSP